MLMRRRAEIRSLFAPDDQFFAYFDPQDPATCQVALANLERYIAHHGPFDGVLAFSQGAALAATHIVRMARRTPAARPFRLAIFIAGGVAVDPDRLMDHGELLQLSPETDADAGAIAIPSAHIYGRNDDLWPGSSETLSSLCLEELRSVYVHQGGHEIPGSSGSSRGDLAGTVHVIRRAVDKAEHLQ